MAYRVLEVTLLSAKDLKSVNLITRMEVYAVATISGDPITRQCTTPDPHGGRHPTWNATLRFTVPPTAEAATGCLHVLLRAERSLGDRDVGEVIVPLADILAGAGPGDLGPRPPQFAYFQVRKVHRTETRGTLYLSYSLGPVVAPQVPPQARAGEPVLAYPAQVQLLPSLPPPPPQATGHMAVPAPLPEKTAGHVAVPSPPKPAVHVAVPPSPKPSGYMTVPSPAKPAVHVAMPPSQEPSGGNVAAPSPAKPAGHVTVPPSPKPVMHVAVPPSPKPAGHAAVSPPPKPSGQVAASPRTVNNNSNLEFGIGLGAGLVGGAISGMLAGGKRGEAITFLPEATFARSRKEAGSKTYGRDVVTSYVQ